MSATHSSSLTCLSVERTNNDCGRTSAISACRSSVVRRCCTCSGLLRVTCACSPNRVLPALSLTADMGLRGNQGAAVTADDVRYSCCGRHPSASPETGKVSGQEMEEVRWCSQSRSASISLRTFFMPTASILRGRRSSAVSFAAVRSRHDRETGPSGPAHAAGIREALREGIEERRGRCRSDLRGG